MTDVRTLVLDQLSTADAPCVTSSFQAECVVLVHLLREARPDIPVLFLDTVHHFPETCEYRDQMVRRWDLNLVTLRATVPSPGLWRQSTQDCCAVHKVGPLFGALEDYDVWFTGLRREQSPSRATSARSNLSRWLGPCPAESQPARHVDHQTGLGLRESARHSAVAAQSWLHQHRLRAVHDPAVRSVRRPLGAVGRTEAGMWHSHPAGRQ